MKRAIIFESLNGAVIDMPNEPANLIGYAAHLKGLGFLTEYREGKVRPTLYGIQKTVLHLIIDDDNLKGFPVRIICPAKSLNKFCYEITAHQELKRRAEKKKGGEILSGFITIRRALSESQLLKELIEAGCPENWTPKPLEY